VRERDRFRDELRALGAPERELAELEGEQADERKPRTILLVAGVEFPRYKKERKPDNAPAGWKPKWWKAKRLKRIREDKPRSALSPLKCRQPAEKALKYAPDVLAGSDWRMRALRVAVQKLSADPTLQVCLFDMDKGTEERVRLQKGTLATVEVQRFLVPLDSDYRLEIVSTAKDPKTGADVTTRTLKPLTDWKLDLKKVTAQPQVRFHPFITEVGTGAVDKTQWLNQRAANLKWLDEYAKRPNASRLLSIVDVYRRIESLGRHAPYTLQELHLWGHASSSAYSENSGAAFANTDHVQIKGRSGRHLLDLDARATLDFEPGTIDRTRFRMAFAKGAMSYVWGCNWSRPLFDVLGQIMDQLGQKPLKDETPFTLRWRPGTGGLESWFRKLLALGENDKTTGVKKDGAFVRQLFVRLLRETYMQQLADASAHCVTGGVPGVGSEYDNKSEKGSPCLSSIPMAPLYGETQNMTRVLRFYAKHFNVAFNRDGAHPEFGRGYALYCPR
jgi:hypothetical protein